MIALIILGLLAFLAISGIHCIICWDRAEHDNAAEDNRRYYENLRVNPRYRPYRTYDRDDDTTYRPDITRWW